jgi:hypothetical protein
MVFLSASAQAQRGGGMSAGSHAAGGAPRAAMQAPRAGTARAMPGTRTGPRGGGFRPRTGAPGVRGTGSRTGSQTTTRRRFDGEREGGRFRAGCGSAPGLGFDAVHQSATCGSEGREFRGRGFQDPFFFPFYDGGYDGGYSEPDYPVAGDDGSAAPIPQPEGTDVQAQGTGRGYQAPQPAPVPAPAAETANSAPAENEEFVFVRRDGTVFFAVAYTWDRGTLRYITPQGLRHSVTKDALDLDATREFNEQRGMNFRLPA